MRVSPADLQRMLNTPGKRLGKTLAERNTGVSAAVTGASPAPGLAVVLGLKTSVGHGSRQVAVRAAGKAPSRGEQEMMGMLENRLAAGEFHSFQLEGVVLKVGEPVCRYMPDFSVWRHDGTLLCIEIKGKKKWDDALVKFKAARLQYPKITFQMWERSADGWRELYAT